MKLTRGWILTIGPIVLVATCYAIAAPSRASLDSSSPVTNDEAIDESNANTPLQVRCEESANSLKTRLLSQWKIVIHEPFVLGGDLSVEELEQHYRETIVPTARALAVTYFPTRPRHPIVILLCTSDQRFRECNLCLDDQERNQYSGLYSRKHRRVIVNIASGEGTLAHEMTHALAHADFPTMPEWFDEGLASLHEECEFSADGRRLIGNENWRHQVALEALFRGELRMLEDVTSKRFGSMERASVDYAHVRTLCLYLQERGLLESFYQTCRSNSAVDPTGLQSLCAITDSPDPKTLDDAFRAWLISRRSNTP